MDIGGMVPPKYEDAAFPISIFPYTGVRYMPQPSCWHEDLEIKLIHEGKTIVNIDSALLTACTDEMIFVNPYQIHSMPMLEGNDRMYSLFMVNLDFFQACGIQSLNLRKVFLQQNIRIRSHIQNRRLAEILQKILLVTKEQPAYGATWIQGLLLEFFSILLTEEVSGKGTEALDPARMRYYHAIAPAVEVIHSDYNKKLTSGELADRCSMSLYYFCRVFKRVMGATPVQYQTEYRMRIADMLLRDGQMSIAAIAHMVGYEDETYFSRCYKNYKGISPRQEKNKV